MPRSAVKVSKSHESKVWDLQNRALDLETQLRQNEKNPEATDRLRIPYCETMADLLLADALFSLSHEVVQRLWRNCFYERIKDLRSKIHKEKKRLQRLKKNSSGGGGGGGGDSSMLAALDTNFMKFLQEAIALYNYIANHLEKKLLPPGMMLLSQENDYSQSAAYSESQQTQVTPSSASNEKNLDAIIPVLHLIYIHLGDLHRYANQLPQAQEKYQNAATLGPGHGHAYNQIAVVCQLKEQQGSSPLSAVALYWYCRSLLPDEEPFLVAKSNLQRLFGSNREWLLAQQAEVATVTHATKAAAVRAFLAQFADLHYDFYMGISPLNYPAPLAIKISKSMESFAGLLKLSAFGDALVCKMVTILAFSECHTPEQAAESGDASVVVQTTALVVRTTTYQMASLLADRVLLGLNKLKAAGGGASGGGGGGGIKPVPNLSVRLLLPLLLVAEFTAHREATSAVTTTTATSNSSMMPTMARSNGPEIQYKQALRTFWKKMVEVWNLLHPLAVAAGIDESKVDGLKEYEALRGFAPFSFMTAPNNNTTSSASQAADGADLPLGFLTSEEYVPLLLAKIQDGANNNNNNNASTQETGSTANSSKNATNMEQGRIKIARMLCLAKSLAEEMNSELGLSICRVSTGEYAWIEKEQEAAAVVMEDDDHAMVDIQTDSTRKTKDGDGNVLVYQEAVGGGPALLVPGALLQNQAPAPASIVHPTPVVATAAVATPQPAAGVAPFGGLGVDAASMRMTTPAATTMNASKPMAQQQQQQQPGAGVNLNSMLSGAHQVPPPGMMTMQPPAPVNPPPGFGSPAPLASSTAMGMAPPGLGVVPPSQPMQPLSDSLHLLGGVSLATANPFASSASSTSVSDKNTSNMPFMQPMHQQNSSFLAPDDQAMDGVNLLDSGLLNSLWGGVEDANNSSTKNPFAAS